MTKHIPLGQDQFLGALRAAFRAELTVAYTCADAGAVGVLIPAYRVAPDWGSRAAFRDNGDLHVQWRHNTRWHRYEVKHRLDLPFTGCEDFPFDTVFVDEVGNLDAKDPRPNDAYFICNAALDTALYINLGQIGSFHQITKFDKRYGQEIAFYAAPIKCVQSVPLVWR